MGRCQIQTWLLIFTFAHPAAILQSAAATTAATATTIITTNTTTTENGRERVTMPPAVTSTSTSTTQQPYRPHILLFVMDDLGSNDLGLHGRSGIHTPAADALAQEGIYLSNYYVLPYCSPTRAALLTGRYPLHTGCHKVIADYETQGLPLDEITLADILRGNANDDNNYYSTHAVGKWHLGHSHWEQTPTFRGFDSFYGYYLGWEDYFTHYKPSSKGNAAGYDLRFDARPHCGQGCSQLMDERGNYSTRIFTQRAIDIIRQHAQQQQESKNSKPLFLYVAQQAVHFPNQVPDEYILDDYKNRTDWTEQRRTYAGMLTAADESLRNITAALKETMDGGSDSTSMWDNTLVIFTTDNGGPTNVCSATGASNYPLRGGKCTLFQGGTTGDGFLSGPALRKFLLRRPAQQSQHLANNNITEAEYGSMSHLRDPKISRSRNLHTDNQNKPAVSSKGSKDRISSKKDHLSTTDGCTPSRNGLLKYPHIFHVVDWLPTLAEMLDIPMTPATGKPLDGVSHLEALRRQHCQDGEDPQPGMGSDDTPPPREEVFVGYAEYDGHWYGPAIRWRQWKLIQGASGGPETLDPSQVPPGTPEPAPGGVPDAMYQLYHLETDPTESVNVVDDYPVLLNILQGKLRDYQQSFVPPIGHDPAGCPFHGPVNTSRFGPTWMPWCQGATEILFYR